MVVAPAQPSLHRSLHRSLLLTALVLATIASALAGIPADPAAAANVPVMLPPGLPPAPLSEADRHPIMAPLQEDGLRDPQIADLSLPETLEDLVASLTALPENGAPSVDAFALP